jgi:tetratricopeptide (TPR) repeat protein
VITANSPASQGEDPSNWEAVLWHEFCHVITLTKTRNKMPRWLSEGISVYEEGQEDATWGAPLSPQFRAMILGDGLTPLSKLSGAFLAPETPLHLQFAYFESALAVEFLVQRAGLGALKGLLDDLGTGTTINEALPERTKTSLEQLDRDFAEFARARAGRVAPEATWEEPELPPDADSQAVQAWLEKRPKSFWGLRRLGARLIAEEKWERAREVLETLKGLYPEYVGAENAYVLLANVARQTSNPAAEHAILEELAARDGDATAAYLRLLELDAAAGDWRNVARNARRMLAVNPLIPAGHRALARAAEHLGERAEAVAAYRALVLLDETDPADVHYRLANLLRQDGKLQEARREVLKSLEEAPRFLEAHRLLLELVESDKPPAGP